MGNLCVIPARGGSKRIPRKNIKLFLGRPILAYSIEAAHRSGLFTEVMVSTDDEEIAQVALEYGATVPFMRSAKTSDDFATTADVLIEVLDWYMVHGEAYEVLCCLYPTAPFVTEGKLRRAFSLLGENVQSVVTACRFSSPPQRGIVMGQYGLEWWLSEYADTRTQDLESILQDAGQFYMAYTETYRKECSFLKGNAVPFIVPDLEVQDIDNPSDWSIAEFKYAMMAREEEGLSA